MQILGRLDSSSVRLRLIEARVPAGFPSPAEDFAETTLSLDELVGARAPSVYLVRAAGESMIGVGIFDNDLLVVDGRFDLTDESLFLGELFDWLIFDSDR